MMSNKNDFNNQNIDNFVFFIYILRRIKQI